MENLIRETICEYNDSALFMDGFDDCIIGMCVRYGQPVIAAYDLEKVIQKLMGDGMTREEAVEFFEFNQVGAWVGDSTPCFVTVLDNPQTETDH